MNLMLKKLSITALIAGISFITILPANAASPSKMQSICKGLAAKEYGTRESKISVKYEGQRSNGTHAVNGTYETSKMVNTFQCSFNKAGTQVVDFIKNTPRSKVNEGAL
jgi:hypothetical protein